MPLAQFAVAFNGASWVDPDSVALMVMQSMLGSWNKNAGGGKHMGLVPPLFAFLLSFCHLLV
jgi:mitochondrial-processing peptidase subunit beta